MSTHDLSWVLGGVGVSFFFFALLFKRLGMFERDHRGDTMVSFWVIQTLAIASATVGVILSIGNSTSASIARVPVTIAPARRRIEIPGPTELLPGGWERNPKAKQPTKQYVG